MAKSTHPSSHASAHPALEASAFDQAFADGDFARARSLGDALAAAALPQGATERARVAARRSALGLDPYVVRVGLVTAVAYAAAWAYALAQH